MKLILVIILVLIFVGFYLYNNNFENFRLLDDRASQTIGYSNDNIQNIGYNTWKQKYIEQPYPTEPNVDYQDYLNEISGYDGATRSYNNPYYAQTVADGLDT